MHQFFKGIWFNFETLRILGAASNGGADLCEVLEAVGEIKDGDPVSWHRAWQAQADRAEATAERCSKAGNVQLARRAYLRAANYTRASGYMFIGATPSQQDPRSLAIAEKVVELFKKAVKLLDGEVHFLEIPYEGGHKLPGYLYLPPASKRLPGKIPILINCGGGDSIQEELFFLNPSVGPDLGYACVTFDGPGQGMSLRSLRLKMRPDWEFVTGHVIDHIFAYSEAHPELELDVNRLAVSGSAMGGYFALRAASDSRIKVCVSIDPLYDMWDFATAHISPTFMGAWMGGWLSNGMVDGIIGLMARFAFQMKWEVSIAGAFWQLDRPTDILLQMRKYTLRLHDGGSFLARVKCPILISGADKSIYLSIEAHTTQVWNSLSHIGERDKALWMAKTPADGALQAKIGALDLSNEYTFRFLDEKFGIRRPVLISTL
ncbi:hypothetical protein MMC22_001137 [Lobaria immixta]|nr:hypothetical protein [Lobaria immixta]